MDTPIYSSWIDIKVTVVTTNVDELNVIKREIKALKAAAKKNNYRGTYSIKDTQDIDPDVMSWVRVMNLILGGGYDHVNERITTRTHNAANKPMMTVKVSLSLLGSKLADRLLNQPVESLIEEVKLMYNCEVDSAVIEIKKYLNRFEPKFNGLPKIIQSIREVCN